MVASGQQRAGRPAPPIRLTRRGWVVLLMLLMIAASLVGALLATASRAVGPVPMIPVSQVVVEPRIPRWSLVDLSVLPERCAGIPFRGVPETFSESCR